MADEARFCARRAARPAGGSVQGQERGELEAVAKILLDVLYLGAGLAQV